ncbi:hypothetical protein B551_0224040 [Cupriavidus sp. HPC(L)]|nr:hypothetical protein B551_0224040 [Cupriavidus sp. HPC(L)]
MIESQQLPTAVTTESKKSWRVDVDFDISVVDIYFI